MINDGLKNMNYGNVYEKWHWIILVSCIQMIIFSALEII